MCEKCDIKKQNSRWLSSCGSYFYARGSLSGLSMILMQSFAIICRDLQSLSSWNLELEFQIIIIIETIFKTIFLASFIVPYPRQLPSLKVVLQHISQSAICHKHTFFVKIFDLIR
jgi:hypothetical protein